MLASGPAKAAASGSVHPAKAAVMLDITMTTTHLPKRAELAPLEAGFAVLAKTVNQLEAPVNL
jgi:hypothetical protein